MKNWRDWAIGICIVLIVCSFFGRIGLALREIIVKPTVSETLK